MGIQEIIEGKKQWRAHVARVKALPPDYQIVYHEMQRYLFKVGPVNLTGGKLLPGIVDFFEEGVAEGKKALELTGPDVAAFCDTLRATRPADPARPVMVAGDPERRTAARRRETGIPVGPGLLAKVKAVALASGAEWIMES